MFYLRLKGTFSRTLYEDFRRLYADKINIDSLYALHQRIMKLSGVREELYDCCINSCCCFTGELADLTACTWCHQPRLDSNDQPQQSFRYLPLEERLKSLFLSTSISPSMKYRSDYDVEGEMSDIFGGQHYRDLLQERVVVDGVEYERFFSDERDIALLFMMDGFQIFKRCFGNTATCWPLIALNLNLPPEIRCHLANVIPIGIIPGPKEPKDFGSFLRPFVEECKRLAIGVRAYDRVKNEYFTLHVHTISASGDMPAVKHMNNFKGTNAKKPCRGCEICGIRDDSCPHNPYYVPLNPPDAAASSWDPANLPLRTESRINAQLDAIAAAPTAKLRKELQMKYGLVGPSPLIEIPSIRISRSFPHEWMHLWLENLVKNLVNLWQGKWKGFNHERSRISDVDWEKIGRETATAHKTIPSTFSRRTPNIWTEKHNFTAEDWSFWMIFLAPHVLKDRFAEAEYYNHTLKLVEILKITLQFSFQEGEIDRLEELIIEWVQEYELYVFLTLGRRATCIL